MRRFRAILAAGSVIIAAATSTPAQAAYADIVFFGDSLSDTGNLYAQSQALLGTPTPVSPPYYNGRFSNGPVWTEHFASGMGQPNAAAPAFAGGNNYAVAGSTLGSYVLNGAPLPFGTIPEQMNYYLAYPSTPVSSDNLYVILGGGNDIRAGLVTYQETYGKTYAAAYAQALADNLSPPDADAAASATAAQAAASDAFSLVRAAADTLTGMVKSLFDLGARHFLIGNVPDVGRTPEATQAGGAALGTVLSQTFNSKLNGSLPSLLGLNDIDLDFLDLAALEQKVLADPGAYGFTNVTDACKPGDIGTNIPTGQELCATPDTYYYFDILHPSARAHQLIAAAALQAVPEPATLGLILIALAALAGGFSRRRQAPPAPCRG